MRKEPYIEKMENEQSRTNAYIVVFKKYLLGKKYCKTKTFSYKKYGGKRKALALARRFRDTVLRQGGFEAFDNVRNTFKYHE